jgi:hypothetical protein
METYLKISGLHNSKSGIFYFIFIYELLKYKDVIRYNEIIH